MVRTPSQCVLRCLAGLLLVFASGALWAQQDVGDLQRAYETRKISILPEEAPPGFLWWSATEGFKTIDEAALLRLAGYGEEARVSRAHHSVLTMANLGILGVVIAGSLLTLDATLAPLVLYPGSLRFNMTELYVGGGMMSVGLMVGVIFVMPIPPDTVPHGRIVQIARDYNDALIDKINQEQQSGEK